MIDGYVLAAFVGGVLSALFPRQAAPICVWTLVALRDSRVRRRRVFHAHACAICLDGAGALEPLACGHAFHRACAARWLAAHPTCPICRAKLTPRSICASR
jgi:hypothetical protein